MKKITMERVLDAVEADDNIGFCTKCGEEQGGCEPDMRRGKCEGCGSNSIFGAEEMLLRMAS